MDTVRSKDGTLSALGSGTDAVLLARIESTGALRVEIANDAARALFEIDGPGAFLSGSPPEVAPLVTRLRDAIARERATREQVALFAPSGARIVADLQLEPTHGDGGVLAVVRLADAIATAPASVAAVGVFRTELGLGAVFVDEALLSLLGLSHEQALGHGWLEALHPDDRARVSRAFEVGTNADEALEIACRILRGGVDERPARIRAVPVRGDGGALAGYLASLEDLTDEFTNAQAVARLVELADVLGEWIVVADIDLRLQYANPAARAGLALPDLAEHPLHVTDFLSPERRVALAEEVRASLASDGQWSGIVTLAGLDGRDAEVDCTIVSHPGADGKIAHYSLLGRDITSLRAMQRALEQSDERFRLMADSSPTGIYFARGGLIRYANKCLADVLGTTVDELEGRSILEWIHPDDLARIGNAGNIPAAQLRPTDMELRVRRKNGDARWVRAHGAPVVDADDEVHGYVGSMIDITDERTVHRGLAMLGRAIESSPDIVSFHDRDGRMFFANKSAREFFGIGMYDDVPPLGPSDYIEADVDVLEDMQHALDTKDHWLGEVTITSLHGRRIPVEAVVVGHRDEDGEIEYYSARAHDLSARVDSETARRRSETVLRAIVQSSPLAIFALDRRGIVHVWNHAAEDVFGWTSEEVVGGRPPFAIEDAREEIDELLARVFRGRTIKGYLGRYARRDRSVVDVELSLAPLRNSEGRVVTAVAILADVTEQVRATQALHESEVWFRSLVQNSSDMVLVMGHGALLTYLSPSALEFANAQPSDVIGKRVTEVFRANDADLSSLQEVFTKLWEEPESTQRATFRIARGDGALRWVELVATNRLEDPAVRGLVINARDITEQFEADEAVRSSEERLRALLSSVSDAICVVGDDGSVIYSNPVADQMFEGTQEDPASSVFGAIDPGDLGRALELWEETRARPGVGPANEVRIWRGDGVPVDAEVIANNLLDDPSVQGIVMTIRDVTERKQSERALRDTDERLRESEARYRAVVDDQIELVCRYLPDTTITFVNRAFADFYGRTRDDLIGSHLLDLRPPVARDSTVARLKGFGRGDDLETYDEWELGADGSRRCYRWIDRAFLDDDGAVVEVQSVGHDVTDERRAAVLTANQSDILEQVARGVPLDDTLAAIASTLEQHFPRLSCAVFLLEPDGTMRLAASPTLPRDGVLDQSVEPAWTTPISAANRRTVLGNVAVYGRDLGEPDDEQRRIFSLGAHLASIAIERKAFEDRLAHQSMHDPLTGLPNRLLFLDRLGLAIARGQRTHARPAVLFLDLDRFKNVNDSLGHDAGDELLVSVARRLESVLRPGDTVARFGGDEFTILCEDLPDDPARTRALDIAQRLHAVMDQPFVVRGAETYVGVSVGIALATRGTETADELLRDADAAMYHAKEGGRGRVEIFDDAIRERALARHSTENALHRAIERGELRVFFQPIVRLEDARCIGAEALVRWQHPERGLVPPAEFVPLAEETGLIVPLGGWVLEQAAAQAARWQLEIEDFNVSINLSARQLADAGLADQVAEVIERNGVTPSNLCFEITESVLMEDADAVIRVIERLRALGVRFAIDDFGTGYSSLGYLKRFAVDTVKIDRAFVDGLADDPGDHAIVSAVVGLAHALSLRVVAEGVENESQLAELVALGCDEAQGYFFAPPQPAPDLRSLVSATRRWRPPGTPLMHRP